MIASTDFRGCSLEIGWCATTGWLAAMIRALDYSDWGGNRLPSIWNHVFLRISWPDEKLSQVLESTYATGTTITPWESYERRINSGEITRFWLEPLEAAPPQIAKVYSNFSEIDGRRYDRFQIVFLFWWIRFSKRDPWGPFRPPNDKYICSEASYEATEGTGIVVERHRSPATTTPESQWLSVMKTPSANWLGAVLHPDRASLNWGGMPRATLSALV